MKIKKYLTQDLIKVAGLNIGLIFIELAYLLFRFPYIKNEIPFWYTKPWGTMQLASKSHLFLLPLIALIIILLGTVFIIYTRNKFYRSGDSIIKFIMSLSNVLLAFSFFNIVGISTTTFNPLINPTYLRLAAPIGVSFLITYLLTPKILDFLTDKGIVTDPGLHIHPAMLLKKPSARGGGLIFVIGFIISTILLTDLSPAIIGLMVAMILGALLGLADDIQNTKDVSFLKPLENPLLRFGLQIIVILPLIIAGTQIKFISNPINGILFFDTVQWDIAGSTFYPLAIAFTIIWILWIINMLSWSNGVDGQFSGVVSIAAIVIAIIALRETPLSPEIKNYTTLAGIVAGASLGLLPFTWHPSKLMWGFGAITAGVSIAALSIFTKAKIATAIIVLLIPFLDGLVTIVRRLIQGRSPLKGDSGHLHHLLIKNGWGIKRVAVFYWIAAALSGYVGYVSADRDPFQTALTLAGVSAFFIVLVNIRSGFKRD